MFSFKYITILLSVFLMVAEIVRSQSLDTATVSLTADFAFSIEPACVQSCMFYNSFGVADYLLAGIGCTSTIYNACYCTQIVDKRVSTILSTCINTLCEGTTEIAPALSLYDSYCAGAGYPRSVAVSTTGTSSTPATTTASTSSTPTNTSPSSSSGSTSVTSSAVLSPSTSSTQSLSTSSSPPSSGQSSTPSSNTSSSKSNTGAIAGGVVGGVVGLALIIAAIFFLLRRKQHKPEHHEAVAAASTPPREEDHKEVAPATSVSPVSAEEHSLGASKSLASGRTELDHTNSQYPATGQQGRVQSHPPRYGLHAEEMDAEGRKIGELRAEGKRNVNELP